MWHPYGDLAQIDQRMTATVPRIIASRLNGTIAAGTVVLLHRCCAARLVPAAHLHISHAKDIFAPVCDRFRGLAGLAFSTISKVEKSQISPTMKTFFDWQAD